MKIGVTESTVWNWERNATSPALPFLPKIIEFLGYSPFPVSNSLPERLVSYRKINGLSRKRLASILGVDVTTLARWERGEGKPTRKSLEKIESL